MSGDLLDSVEWHVFHEARSSKIIDQLVACDGINPGRERLVRIVGMPSYMKRQQRLLNEILHISRTASRQPGLVISTQVPAQPAKNIAVRPFVAAEGCHHETFQFSLDSVHPRTYPIHSRLEQCRLQRMYGFLLCGPILPREHIGSRNRERVTDPVGPRTDH